MMKLLIVFILFFGAVTDSVAVDQFPYKSWYVPVNDGYISFPSKQAAFDFRVQNMDKACFKFEPCFTRRVENSLDSGIYSCYIEVNRSACNVSIIGDSYISVQKRCAFHGLFDPATDECSCPAGTTEFINHNGALGCEPVDVVLTGKGSNVCYGNPVLPLTGNKTEFVQLPFSLAGFQMEINYDSESQVPIAGTTAAQPAAVSPGFGSSWFSTFHRRMRVVGPGDGIYGPNIIVSRGNGRVLNTYGRARDTGLFVAYGRARNGVYVIEDLLSRTVEEYDERTGLLGKLSRIDGRSLAMTYSDDATPIAIAPAPGYLIAVRDDFGREIKFTYELPAGGVPEREGVVKTIIGPDGELVSLGFDGFNLQAIEWPDGRRREFVYEDSRWPRALTGIIDEERQRYATFTYSQGGLALSTEHVGGVDKFEVRYAREPGIEMLEEFKNGTVNRTYKWRGPEGLTVKTPDEVVLNLEASSATGVPLLLSRTQPAGAGSAAAQESRVMDLAGNTTVEVDFNGKKICRQWSSGMEVGRVDGLAADTPCPDFFGPAMSLPEEARRTWVARIEFGLEIDRTEPGLRIATAYNDVWDGALNRKASCAPSEAILPNGRKIFVPCSITERATTDMNGSRASAGPIDAAVPQRRWEYMYNAQGQALSVKDPVGNSTTYRYYTDTTADHTRGDLAEMINGAGHKVRYTKYTRGGKLLEEVDPNGVVTRYEYDLRGRPIRRTKAGQASIYAYTATGLLQRVTSPDASYLNYEYDSAQRLIAVADNLGNRIEYTLDNSGRRREERVKDPGGLLKRKVSRVFDALGRTQQVTGKE